MFLQTKWQGAHLENPPTKFSRQKETESKICILGNSQKHHWLQATFPCQLQHGMGLDCLFLKSMHQMNRINPWPGRSWWKLYWITQSNSVPSFKAFASTETVVFWALTACWNLLESLTKYWCLDLTSRDFKWSGYSQGIEIFKVFSNDSNVQPRHSLSGQRMPKQTAQEGTNLHGPGGSFPLHF